MSNPLRFRCLQTTIGFFCLLFVAGILYGQQEADLLQSARALVAANRLNESEAMIRNFLSKTPQSAEAHFLLGYVLFREQRARESLAEFTAGAAIRRPNANELKTVASDYVLLKDFSDADKWFSEVTKENPNDADAWYLLGRTKYNENRFEEAISDFDRSLTLRPKHIPSENNLGLCFQGLNRQEEAQKAFQTAIDWQSGTPNPNPQPYLNLGVLFLYQNQIAKAVPYLEAAARFAPDNPRIHEELAKTYTAQNELLKAQQQLERAVLLSPDSSGLHFKLGQIYRRLGQNERAKQEFEICSKLNSTHSSKETPNPFTPN